MTATEAYLGEDVQQTFRDVVRRFSRKYGRPLDDVLSEANEYFMGAYLDYDPARCGSFRQWVRIRVWGRLLDALRKEEYRKARLRRTADRVDMMAARVLPDFDVEAAVRRLSRDGKAVVRMIVEMPVGLRLNLTAADGDTPADWRRAVQTTLREAGWGRTRIERAFRNARRKL